jgi:hypothetical protein
MKPIRYGENRWKHFLKYIYNGIEKDNNIPEDSIPFFVIYVPRQQPQGCQRLMKSKHINQKKETNKLSNNNNNNNNNFINKNVSCYCEVRNIKYKYL